MKEDLIEPMEDPTCFDVDLKSVDGKDLGCQWVSMICQI
jgi:hypothetical protein